MNEVVRYEADGEGRIYVEFDNGSILPFGVVLSSLASRSNITQEELEAAHAAVTPTQPTPEEQVEALEAIAGDVSMGTRWVATTAEANVNTLLAAASLLRALLTQQSQDRAEIRLQKKIARGYQAELDRAVERLELIARNAESWHHDEEALRRAMNVIAAWARGGEIPEVLLTDLRAASPGKGAEGEPADE